MQIYSNAVSVNILKFGGHRSAVYGTFGLYKYINHAV